MKKVYFLVLLSLTFIFSCNQDSFISSVKVPVNESITPPEITTGGAIAWKTSDALNNVNVPTTATVNGTLNISFDYETKDYRRVYVSIKSADWSTEYVKDDIRDLGPIGNKGVSLDLTGIPIGSYKVAIEMLENIDTYTGFSPQIGSWSDLTIQ